MDPRYFGGDHPSYRTVTRGRVLPRLGNGTEAAIDSFRNPAQSATVPTSLSTLLKLCSFHCVGIQPMATANLILHRGAREVTRDELALVPMPTPTKSWAPVGHVRVLETALTTIREAGFTLDKMKLGLSGDGARFFGTLDLATPLSPDGIVTLAVGVRNSIDKTFPMGFCAGSRVFVCDNLAFRAELMVRRKHSLNGVANFSNDIVNAVTQLNVFKEAESTRIVVLTETVMPDERAESFILRAAAERGIISLRQIPVVVKEWKEPCHEVFEPRTSWCLFNAFTSALGKMEDTNPADLARRTMRLSAMLAPADAAELPLAV